MPLGGTGEYGAMARAERVRFAGAVVEATRGKVPVVAGVLDPGYHDALEAAHGFADAGVDALMVLTPYYTTPTQAGLRDYFLRLADASPLPIADLRDPVPHAHRDRADGAARAVAPPNASSA